MKVCKKCNQEKEYLDYYSSKETVDGVTSYCKECLRNRSAGNYQKDTSSWIKAVKKHNVLKEDGYHRVYHLPNHTVNSSLGYIGITDNVYERMCTHRSAGRNTEGYSILAKSKNRDAMLQVEKEYGSRGYSITNNHSN